MPSRCRLIVDPPAEGAWNMAVDEALLRSASTSGEATLRLYRWSEPTLSLGYFQPHADREKHPASLDLPLIRRASGGGALVHDRELTYSLVLPAEGTVSGQAVSLTCLAHRALISALETIVGDRLPLTTCSKAIPRGKGDEPFLCFQRRAEGDLLWQPKPEDTGRLGGDKVCGSAQRRRGEAVLQHGGLLLRQSAHAPELPGLGNLGLELTEATDLEPAIAANLLESLHLQGEEGGLSEQENELASRIVETKYRAEGWTKRR